MFIQVENLTKKFKNSLAVNKINFSIEKNKTVGLLGPNGCGKTTTIGMMLGLIKPSAGKIIIDNKNLDDKIKELSEELNLKIFLSKKTGELSSGQKNRVSLAKSLINEPEILFLDEPTASLDPDIGDYIRSYIQSYKTKNKITIFLASHNMAEVERLCDSIIMMKNGKIIDRGTCEEIIKKHGRNNLEETFLKLARSKDEVS